MKTKHFTTILIAFVIALLSAACGKDDEAAPTVVGVWLLEDYSIVGNENFANVELRLDSLVMTADNHFKLYYPNGTSNEGTYEAGTDFLRFDTVDQAGETMYFLMEIKSLDDRKLTVFYHDESGFDLNATLVRKNK
jgi:hypothetical protein